LGGKRKVKEICSTFFGGRKGKKSDLAKEIRKGESFLLPRGIKRLGLRKKRKKKKEERTLLYLLEEGEGESKSMIVERKIVLNFLGRKRKRSRCLLWRRKGKTGPLPTRRKKKTV